MALIVAALDKAVHDRAAFDCGETALNHYLATRAAKHQTQRISRSFVLCDEATPARILGYYTLSNCQIVRAELSPDEAKTLPRHPTPGVLLARLAVDRQAQGQRIGHWLLMDAIKRCALIGRHSGVYALVVDAKNHTAAAFYQRFGFRPISERPATLYLPLETALRAVLG